VDLLLQRGLPAAGCTIGRLSIDGAFECWTLEDLERAGPKIHGKTAIPAGTYSVRVTWSRRFNTHLPLLLDVPGFDGIRIHPGNTADNTEGCILVGADKGRAAILRSRAAFAPLLAKLEDAEARGEPITLRILSRQAPAQAAEQGTRP
jgi:hypothetical protein